MPVCVKQCQNACVDVELGSANVNINEHESLNCTFLPSSDNDIPKCSQVTALQSDHG